MVKSHRFCGVVYEIITQPVDGICSPPETNPFVAIVDGVDKSSTSTKAVIHEALHAIRPKMTEKEVTQIAEELNRFMRRLYIFKPK